MARKTPPRDISEALNRAMVVHGVPPHDAPYAEVDRVLGHACTLLCPENPSSVRLSVEMIWKAKFSLAGAN